MADPLTQADMQARRRDEAARALSKQGRAQTRRQAIEAARQWDARPEYPARDEGDDMPKTRAAVR